MLQAWEIDCGGLIVPEMQGHLSDGVAVEDHISLQR